MLAAICIFFHYFFMRKFWFVYLAKAVVLFPGGYSTLDELFEILTLVQTRKTRKHMPIVLFGAEYWDEVIRFDAMAKYGTVSPSDLKLFHRTEAYEIITHGRTKNALGSPGPAP
jgi:predicted Rossmann-fold nucleotide-binding protein